MALAQNKKKNLLVFFSVLFLFSGVIFAFSDVHSAYAVDRVNCDAGWSAIFNGTTWSCMKGNAGIMADNAADTATAPLKWVVQWVLYGIFVVISWLVSAALTLFQWAIDPNYVSGSKSFFNAASTYEMWKFVRDFFNLFFILSLLYLAFTTIFQVAKDYKKALLNLVIMALLVNFSFPISRFLIDVTNVPMYFFANQIFSGPTKNGQNALSSVLSASELENILIEKKPDGSFDTGNPKNTISRLIMAIVFMFIFAITLIVLAVMFVIRLIALVILVIFSSAGFVGAVIPGMAGLSEKWWKQFWNYALYGPAAMLMLLIATRFFAEISKNSTLQTMQTVSSGITQDASMSTFIGSMAMFSIPIVMLWFTIGLAGSFSLAGASAVTGWGKGFVKGAGKKFSGYNAVARNLSSFSAARKKRQDEKNKNNFGTRLGGGLNKKQDQALAFVGSKAAAERVKNAHNKETYEQVEEDKKSGVSDPELKARLVGEDKIKAAAAAISLSERKAISSSTEFAAALKVLGGNTKEVAALIEKAGSGAMEMTAAEYGEVTNSDAFKNKDGSLNTQLKKQLDVKIVKEGQANTLVEHQMSRPGMTRDLAVENVLNDIKSVKEKVKQESLFTNPANKTAVERYVTGLHHDVRVELDKAAAQESQAVQNILAPIP